MGARSKPYLAIPEGERRPAAVSGTFDDFLRRCYAAGVRDEDRLAAIDYWNERRELKIKKSASGIEITG